MEILLSVAFTRVWPIHQFLRKYLKSSCLCTWCKHCCWPMYVDLGHQDLKMSQIILGDYPHVLFFLTPFLERYLMIPHNRDRWPSRFVLTPAIYRSKVVNFILANQESLIFWTAEVTHIMSVFLLILPLPSLSAPYSSLSSINIKT